MVLIPFSFDGGTKISIEEFAFSISEYVFTVLNIQFSSTL